ncbi:MAG: hypothetical protein IKI15_09950 [Lachnospiraceae bacterium]|nr:hypothetical protein [Lachnospiraceae bacterium]
MNSKVLSAIEGLMKGICNQNSKTCAANKKAKLQIIQQEIDYDKLAEAMIRAYEKVKKESRRKNDSTSSVLSSFAVLIFVVYGVILAVTVIAVVIAAFKQVREMNWVNVSQIASNIIVVVIALLIAVTTAIMSYFSFRAAGEVSVEEDRSYVAAVVSALASMAALIVALVALLK